MILECIDGVGDKTFYLKEVMAKKYDGMTKH
jgi:hypothetical protein